MTNNSTRTSLPDEPGDVAYANTVRGISCGEHILGAAAVASQAFAGTLSELRDLRANIDVALRSSRIR